MNRTVINRSVLYGLLIALIGLMFSACDMGLRPDTAMQATDVPTIEADTAPITDTQDAAMQGTETITATVDRTDDAAVGTLLLAYTLINQPFVNSDGEVSGSIEDLIINLRTGNILFAQIEYGGFLDIGDTELLVPLEALHWRSVEADMILSFDEQSLINYPDLRDGSPRLDDPAWYDGVVAFWNDLGFGSAAETVSAIDPTTDVIVRASDLLSFSLVDLGAGIGRIQNLLINLEESRAHYLLIGFGPTAADDDAYIIPFSAVDVVSVDANEMVFDTNLTQELLLMAPQFDRSLFQGQIGALDPIYLETADDFWEEAGFTVVQ